MTVFLATLSSSAECGATAVSRPRSLGHAGTAGACCPPNPRSGALYSVPPDERDLEAVSMHIRRFVFLQGNDVGVLELSLET